jgi:cytochrome P450
LERASIDAAGWAMFGLDLLPQAERIGNLLRGYFTGAAKAQIFDFLAREESDFVWASRPRARFGRRWFAEVDALIAKRRALPPGPDLFSVLVAGQAAPDDVALRDQFAGMLAAGFETTAQAMFWTLFLLAGAPEEQARIGAELVARPPASVTASADFAAWPRLRACLLEALRLYPPSSVLSRVALGPDVAGGVRIPAGSLVMVSQWVMHRHERLWTAADRFRPERFAGQSLAVALARPGFMPFGAGPRTCLGAGLALTEATLLLAHLLARYRIGLEPGQRVMPRAIVSTRPDRQPWFTLAEVAR